MKYENNRIVVVGILDKKAEFSHRYDSCNVFYKTNIIVERFNGTKDILPVMISNNKIDGDWLGMKCMVEGTIRTYNKKINEKKSLVLYIFAEKIVPVMFYEPNINEGFLDGFICKEPIYRLTPLKKQITDLIVAVNRPLGKTDYIPCICWGSVAKEFSTLQVGTRILLNGRLQSREYIKKNDIGGEMLKTTYEFSIQKGSVIQEKEDNIA